MFPEYRDLISQLKTTDTHFHSLFEKHNNLDKQITDLERRPADYPDELHAMKQEKLALKDAMFEILQTHTK
ncbi:hypothetical protein NFHSH190041_04880 [Shewanella sp. NFH-SH190041]|uniref:YdcH family protein n=1 Tax=Shewanella sp. NFH-SH190041 TaxID=2950245 RepID=UPI0021C34162|nr:YdcH family protein [Shewanella sp. NFH-SH190041]BDM63036.1 hypothetical protein NFHSH190041_04880 [Shewanella sp. NFH-SH190041]